VKKKTDHVEGRVLNIDQVKGYVSRKDQLQCMGIAVDRFFKRACSLDRLLIGGTDFKTVRHDP